MSEHDRKTWQIRVTSELNRSARDAAKQRAISLSQFVRDSVEQRLAIDAELDICPVPEPKLPGTRYTMVSLFTGAGGLDVGLESTGMFDLLGAVELEEAFCKSLEANQKNGLFGTPNTQIIEADLSKFRPQELMDRLGIEPGELDVLVGGPPCQTFSTAGRRAGIEDPRGQLIWNYLDFVRALKPKVFLMENVRGLLSSAIKHRPIAERPARGGAPLQPEELPGSLYELWLSDALAIGDREYRIDTFEVNAVNYGAPQLRERVLIFGNRLNKVTPFLSPTHSNEDDDLPPFRTLRDALEDLDDPTPTLLDFSPRKKSYLKQVPTGGNWRSLPDEVARESMGRAYHAKGGRSGWWRRLSWDLPSPTITTMPNHSSTSLCHPEETRVLSVAECARIQEFPDGWKFLGTPAQQMKQVGNAVPARLGAIAGATIVQLLEDTTIDANPDTPPSTKNYINSHVRTRRWWKDGQAVVRA